MSGFTDRSDGADAARFPPTDAALAQRLLGVDPSAYARTRNHLAGSVTHLSPYLTHGFTDVPSVIRALRERLSLPEGHKLVFELAWREYFHHLWGHWGEGIFDERRPPPGHGYASVVPEDLRSGATGVPCVDRAVRTLYRTGYLHNHARMWLASYTVHLRKVDWRVGADWMYAHLLDGDLASNHLSWQWVAGTLTGRPYLFDAANVERYAPAWASPGTAVDRSYEALEAIARSCRDLGPEPTGRPAPTVEPELRSAAPPPTGAVPLPAGPLTLVHPWSMAAPTGPAIGIVVTDFHERRPWSGLRWHFVMQRLRALCGEAVLVGSCAAVGAALAGRDAVAASTLNAGYRDLLEHLRARCQPAARYFDDPQRPCRSFSEFWQRVQGRRSAP